MKMTATENNLSHTISIWIDAETFLRLVGRKKEGINRQKGKKIFTFIIRNANANDLVDYHWWWKEHDDCPAKEVWMEVFQKLEGSPPWSR